jgi:dTDP-4-dehydrorhamnose reductase
MKSILILGKGFVGKNLSEYLNEVNIDHELYSKSMVDYTDADKFNEFLKDNKDRYHCIVNTSGYTGSPNVDGCESNKKDCWHYNVNSAINVVKVANHNYLPVVHVGSGCIYTGYDKDYTEEDEPNFGLYSNDSSFYSKCKHASEILLDNTWVYILRIRIPFTHKPVPKNYFTKLIKYDDLINEENSVTSITDFNNFMVRFMHLLHDLPGGIYNTVNPGRVKASDVVDILKKYDIYNERWGFIETKNLNTIAKRSNCVLSTEKIEKYNLPFPNALESIERDIKILKSLA